ncbi:ParB/RepB/Spo0J family partition protein [Chitinasiproducens palmae]|uniref:ParB-like nuclease domain-containing protein n=1 Tax=Chitinasiproducens palmae TaxID=1770053 RepID=A0A1H2PMU7_9BURK|nr:ParB N-terminal domain-containing protein [Chitinasiproducens palmae]SDV47938.1 ParB-like nuclease domain-containing protein [Chitinasiproducens palmae]
MKRLASGDLPLLAPIVTGNTKAAVAQAGGKSADLWMLAPDQIHYDALDNIRPLNIDRVRHLANLMLANGYDRKSPLGCFVRKVDGQDLIFVYAGQHRYHAAKLAIAEGADIQKLPVIIDAAKSVSRVALIIAGVNGNDGERLTPLELSAAVAELEREGLDAKAIAKSLCVTDQTLRDLRLLRQAPERVHEMVRRDEVAATLAIEQLRQHGPEKALANLEAALARAVEAGKPRATAKHVHAAEKPPAAPPRPPRAVARTVPKSAANHDSRPNGEASHSVPDRSNESDSECRPPPVRAQSITTARRLDSASETAPPNLLLRQVAEDGAFRFLSDSLRQRIARFLETNPQ